MTDPDVTSDQEVALTPGHRKGLRLEEDQHLTPEGLKDHVQKIGDHPVGVEGLYLILQTRSLDQDRGPRAEAGIPIDQKLLPF